MTLRQSIVLGLKRLLPREVFTDLMIRRAGFPEPEIELLPRLCDPSRISIDVGGADGVYTRHMLRHSRECVLFEPRPDAAAYLEQVLSGLVTPVRVERIALSDSVRDATLLVCVDDGGLSTIESRNPLADRHRVNEVAVRTSPLDDFTFDHPIGLIKIDVEGHEEAVIRGSKDILERDHPCLIIEIEERHNPGNIQRVFSFLSEFDYSGFFYFENRLNPLTNFDIDIDQDVGVLDTGVSRYINNFIFLDPRSRNRVNDLISESDEP